jgi:hypothetical protein
MSDARVIRITGAGIVNSGSVVNVVGVQVIGGTAADGAVLYNDTSAVAGNKWLQVTGGTFVDLSIQLRFENLYVSLGTGATEVLIHVV